MGTLLDWFPDARVLWITRDPRSVVASWRARSEDWTDAPTTSLARRWVVAARLLDGWLADSRVREVRYEAVVSDPARHLTPLGEFLELELDASALAEGAGEDRGFRAGRGQDPHGSIGDSSLDRWRSILTRHDVGVIEHIAGSAMDTRGMPRVLTPRHAAAAYARQRATDLALRLPHFGRRHDRH